MVELRANGRCSRTEYRAPDRRKQAIHSGRNAETENGFAATSAQRLDLGRVVAFARQESARVSF